MEDRSQTQRYRADLAEAKIEARAALAELAHRLKRGNVRALARAARRAQLASAALYTAAACLISPP